MFDLDITGAPDDDLLRMLLTLAHPHGEALRQQRVGGRADTVSRSVSAHAQCDEKENDLVWIAPDKDECNDPRALETLLERGRSSLAQSGVMFLFPPRSKRKSVVQMVRAAGWQVSGPYAFLQLNRSRLVMTHLEVNAMQFVLNERVYGNHAVKALASGAMRTAETWVLNEEVWPTVGYMVMQDAEQVAFHWMNEHHALAAHSAVVAECSSRPGGCSTVLHLLDGHGKREGVGKVQDSNAGEHEARMLLELGPAARDCGVRVPRVLSKSSKGGMAVVIQEHLHGVHAFETARSKPIARELLDDLGRWLGCWNASTRLDAPLGRNEIEERLVGPLRSLSALLEDVDRYEQHLLQLAVKLEGMNLPRVATHNDLTMFNVLVDHEAIPGTGIVDWESASPSGWPLTDLEYAVVDVFSAHRGYRDRVEAWESAFNANGINVERTNGLIGAHVRALSLPEPFVELCHHACWLEHAASDVRKQEARKSEFVRIAQQLVKNAIVW